MCDVFSLAILPRVLCRLVRAGFHTTNDLDHLDVEQISSYSNITVKEAEILIESIRPSGVPIDSWRLSYASMKAEETLDHDSNDNDSWITTFSSNIDAILSPVGFGGGIPIAKVTELYGTPGTGKTQLCLQLAIDVQIPKSLGGLGGRAVYVDADAAFFVERFNEMATAAIKHFQEVGFTRPDWVVDMSSLSVGGMLEGIHYVRCNSNQDLEDIVINRLEDFIVNHPKVKLIVIDSVAFHLRETATRQVNYSDRTAFLLRLSQQLAKIAVKNSLAVIVTNQVTTRLTANGGSYEVAALGESWTNACANRLLLMSNGNECKMRTIRVVKSSYLPDLIAPFYITSSGIRDVETDISSKNLDRPICANKLDTDKRVHLEDEEELAQPSKRFRQ